MGKIGRSIVFPTLEDIIKHNRRHIEASGEYFGVDNLRERGSIESILKTIQYGLFGVDPYPTLVEKAARLTWAITHGHAFYDGNKRTGMSVLYTFLRVNGYQLDVTNEETVNIALRVAGEHPEENYSYEDFVQWIRDRLVLREK